MSVVKADRFLQLKAKVKEEMLRRNQSGSVADYGGTEYDYTVAPAAGKTIRAEHRDKLVEPMRAVNSDLVPASTGTTIREDELVNLETRVAVWAARSMNDESGSDCKSGCTGMCYGGCATGCSGCGSGCETGCTGCGGGCTGCGSGCPTSCGSCAVACSNSCNSCGAACSDTCDTGCKGCTGCGALCADSCGDGCAHWLRD